jgi:putative SOS response-associated peptidase YedK
MAMTEACVQLKSIHDRMPVVLEPDGAEQWLHGSREEALSLCVPYAGVLSIDRTGIRGCAERQLLERGPS